MSFEVVRVVKLLTVIFRVVTPCSLVASIIRARIAPPRLLQDYRAQHPRRHLHARHRENPKSHQE
jgi:hypothetical protein